MPKIYSALFPSIVLILMIGNTFAQEIPPLGSILPKINQEDFKLTPEGNGYTLKITLLDGSSRDEIVELKNAGTPEQYLAVMGTSNLLYPGVTATITYTADKKGYLIKYKYEKIPINIVSISGDALRAAAG